MSDRDQSCEKRISESLQSTLDDIRESLEEGTLFELGLGFDYVAPETFDDQDEGYWRYQLSWGGPSDEFRFYADDPKDYYPIVEYWFLDWFDGAHRILTGPDVELLYQVWQNFMDVGAVQNEYDNNMEG